MRLRQKTPPPIRPIRPIRPILPKSNPVLLSVPLAMNSHNFKLSTKASQD